MIYCSAFKASLKAQTFKPGNAHTAYHKQYFLSVLISTQVKWRPGLCVDKSNTSLAECKPKKNKNNETRCIQCNQNRILTPVPMERTNMSQCRDCTQDIVKHLVDQLTQLLDLLQKALENCSPSH